MSLQTARTQLMETLKELLASWEQTTQQWDDLRRREFERRYIDALRPLVSSAVHAAEQLSKLISKARQDCE